MLDMQLVKLDIKRKFNELKKYNPEISDLTITKINVVGSYNTEKYKEGKSDIDFQLITDNELPSWADINSIVDYINSELIDKYGECEKGNLIDVVAINNTFLDGEVFKA